MPDQEMTGAGPVVDAKVPFLTWRSLLMGVFVSMGGLLFGYDTGQISGFLDMPEFLQRFGTLGPDGKYHFSNAISGTIVGLVSHSFCPFPNYNRLVQKTN